MPRSVLTSRENKDMSRIEQHGTTTEHVRNPETEKGKHEKFTDLNKNLQQEANNPQLSLKTSRSPAVEPEYLTFSDPFTKDTANKELGKQHNKTNVEDFRPASSNDSQRDLDKQRHERNLEDFRPPSSNPKTQEWTVCVNLTTSAQENGVQIGGNAEIQELQRLASQTAGKPVTILAQNIIEDPNHSGKYLVERYEIKDGHVNKLPTEQSKGMAQDLANLLSTATHNYPSKRVALINQSHGGGTAGLSDGHGGSCTLNEFVGAVKQGLAGSGHQKLDLLDFDACSMGNSGVVSQVRGVTEQLVASAAPEMGYGGSYDAQNLSTIITNVLQNPQQSGEALGEAIINAANHGANGNPVESPGNNHHEGTDTLAHYNLQKYDDFKGALNNFGNALAQAARDPDQKEVLSQIIQNTPTYPANEATSANRDLKRFVEQVNEALNNGRLRDPDGSLHNAINALLTSQRQLVESYHANPEARETSVTPGSQDNEQSSRAGYEKMGGLSVFLPPADANQMARNLTPLSRLANRSTIRPNEQMNESDWSQGLTEINKSMSKLESQLPHNLSHEQEEQVAALRQAVVAMRQAKTQEERTAALSNLHNLATSLYNSPLNENLSQNYRAQAQRIIRMRLQNAGNQEDEGWNNFLRSVGR